ncbi:reticulon-like protein B12 [Phragmites australis]|uniref:reticulon-like protein B12 n=1 Tax=Phragmites australis TaxID=29695 RepID=UPI002D7839BE|nr:reticulon-like protein B12 [Phragmites australis]
MDSPGRSCGLFGAQRSLHDLLGGGTVADVALWRRKEVAGGLLAAVVASWALFYCVPGYTLLSFVPQVLMILLTVLFFWAKAARLLNRTPPPVPLMKISEDSMSEAAKTVGNFMNKVLQDFENIALGKDSSLFYKVAFVLFLTSIAGRLTDLITLVYTSVVIALTIPALLEKSEEHIDRFFKKASIYVQACWRACEECKPKVKNGISEKTKLC